MIDVGHPRSLQRNVGRSWLTAALTGALAMGALVAAPGSASAIAAPHGPGTKAATLLPAAPVKTGFIVTVRRAPTITTLTSTVNPVRRGNSVTFIATVTATGSAVIPTGSVVFRNSGVDIGTVPLEGAGRASFTTSSLPEGTHNITATYLGNAPIFDPSPASAVLAQRITAAEKKEPEETTVETPVVVQDDDLERRCRHFKNDEEETEEADGADATTHSPAWQELRRRCHKWWKHQNDWITLVDKGIRRHIEGHYDRGGGHRERWHHHRKHWHHKHHPKPAAVRHFAVTG